MHEPTDIAKESRFFQNLDQRLRVIEDSHNRKNLKFLITQLLKGFLPTCAYFLLVNFGYIINLYFVSRLNDHVMIGAVGLGNTWIECAMLSAIISLNMGLQTLLSQSIVNRDFRLSSFYLQKGFLANCFVFLIFAILLIISGPLLLLFGYYSDLALYTSQYLNYMTIGFFGSVVFDTLKNFAQAHGIYKTPVYIQIGGTILECITSYYFILVADMKLFGLGISRAICEILKAVALMIFIHKSQTFNAEKWYFTVENFKKHFTKEGLEEVWAQLKFQVKAGAATYFEWFIGFINIMLMAKFDTKSYAGSVTATQILAFVWCLPMALSSSLGSHVATAMGDDDSWKALQYLKAAAYIAASMIAGVFVVVTPLAWVLPRMFTTDPEIVQVATFLIVVYVFAFPFDTFQYLFSSVGRSIEKEARTSRYSLYSYYVFGVPCCIILGFVEGYGVKGIWIGTFLEHVLNFILLGVMLRGVDYEKQARMISQKLREEQEKAIQVREEAGRPQPQEEEMLDIAKTMNARRWKPLLEM